MKPPTLFVPVALLTLMAATASAQINIQEKLERKIKERAERKVDGAIDKGLDRTEEGIDEGAKDATKGKKKKDGEQKAGSAEQQGGSSDGGGTNNEGSGGDVAASGGAAKTLKAFSKFDFVPGEQIVAVEDFMQDAVGDFPAKWNTNTSGEVVTIEGEEGHWLKLTAQGVLYPEFLGNIPENCTIEYDVIASNDYTFFCAFLNTLFVDAQNRNLLMPEHMNLVSMRIHPSSAGGGIGTTHVEVKDATTANILLNDREQKHLVHTGPFKVHMSIWRQKARLRVYMNEEKMWDLPRAFQAGVEYRFALETGACEGHSPFIGNFRVAQGAPDTRNKLITEGRLVTRGILFDSGSDRIKAESYGTMKDIASVLTENVGVRVRIIGHTDSDGEDATNIDLSKRRAAAVKEALSKEFAIDAGRMETDGKGESLPVGANDTPQGKANNRRVEFVKL